MIPHIGAPVFFRRRRYRHERQGVTMKDNLVVALLCTLAIGTAGITGPALAQNVLTTHRLSAGLAAEAVAEAVAACAKQGYRVTATVVDLDGVDQASLRGDGASMSTLDAAHDKAYTVLMLGAARLRSASVERLRPAAWRSCRTSCCCQAPCALRSAMRRLPR
jgi:hypothetical protein